MFAYSFDELHQAVDQSVVPRTLGGSGPPYSQEEAYKHFIERRLPVRPHAELLPSRGCGGGSDAAAAEEGVAGRVGAVEVVGNVDDAGGTSSSRTNCGAVAGAAAVGSFSSSAAAAADATDAAALSEYVIAAAAATKVLRRRRSRSGRTTTGRSRLSRW